MTGGPHLAYLGAENALGNTKTIFESSTQLLYGNLSKGQHRATLILERSGNQVRGLSEIFNGTTRPTSFSIRMPWVPLEYNH
jgi:hypothetical protein